MIIWQQSLIRKDKHEIYVFFYLNKVVREEAPLSVQLSLHPALLLNVPHVPDDVAGSQRQLVIVERIVLVLHQDLCSEEEKDEFCRRQRGNWSGKNVPEVEGAQEEREEEKTRTGRAKG